jgi:hypothetical protein
MLATIADGVLYGLQQQDPRAYFEKMARLDPHLLFKYANMLTARRDAKNQPKEGAVYNIVTAIPRTALDDLPEGFKLG